MHRVLFWNHSANIGGAEKSLLDILKFLDRRYFFPIVASSKAGQLSAAAEELGIRTEAIPLNPRLTSLSRKDKVSAWRVAATLIAGLRTIFLACHLVRKEKVDIIYANSLKAGLLATGVKILTGKKIVWHIRDILPEGSIKKIFIFLGERFADGIIANSDFTLSQFSGSPKILAKARRVYSGIDFSEFKPLTPTPAKEWPQFKYLVGVFSMLTPWKGHKCFLEAAESVVKEKPDTGFLIAGEDIYATSSAKPGYRQELEGLVKSKGLQNNVIFAGYRPDTAKLMGLCDIVVSSSIEPEPFGRTIAEAMACAKPVIAPLCGGFKETISDNRSGLFFQCGGHKELSQKILYLLDNPELRLRMGQEGRAIAAVNFDAGNLTRDLENFLRDLLAAKDAPLEDLKYARRRALRWINRVFGKAVCILLKSISQPPKAQSRKDLQKILFLKIAGLGDAVLILPSIKAYSEIFPQAKLSVLTCRELADVFRGLSFIDEVIIYDLYLRDAGLSGFLRMIEALRKAGFDCCVDFEQHLYLTTILSFLSRIPQRIGFTHPAHRRDYLLTMAVRFNDQKHMADTFFDLVRVFAPDKEFSKLEEIKVSDKDKEYISSLFAKNNIAEDCLVIGIHPGTGKRAKMRQWPPEKFARLADKLAAEFNARIIFTGFGADTVLVENIAGKMKSASFNFCGATSLKELAALIQRLDLFISNDTGPMHLGPAMGTLTVGLFGPNTPARYGPFGKEHLALYAAPSCSPCINIHLGKVKNCARPVCMEKLEVGAVFAQIAAKLPPLKQMKAVKQ